MKYQVDNTILQYSAEGRKAFGGYEILLDKAIDLTAGKKWAPDGFTIEKLFNDDDYQDFISEAIELLFSCWRDSGLVIPQYFDPRNYHTIANDQEKHLAAVEKTKLLSVNQFPSGVSKIEQRISQICGFDLEARNPFDNQRVFHFRVVRPMSKDNNPLHRDVWLEDYDNCINLYIPIAGSNKNSSLILFPGSHRWPESRIERTVGGAVINGAQFNVPAVTHIDGAYEVVRPNPNANEVLIFSPYLIHGGAVNLNAHVTRISIELRLWRK